MNPNSASTPHAWDGALLPGRAYPLGATFDGKGTNFSVFSEIAERVDLCLFDEHRRHRHPVFRRRRWFQGRAIHGSRVQDIAWFTLGGKRMAEKNWGEGFAKSLGVFINGAPDVGATAYQ